MHRYAPMLAHSSKAFDSNDWQFELKFDGTRAILYIDKRVDQSIELINRRGLSIEHRYPEFRELWQSIAAGSAVLDGEIVIFRGSVPDFQSLQEREHLVNEFRISLLAERSPATYVAFDLLELDHKPLIKKPLSERRRLLEKIVREGPQLMLSVRVIGNGREFFKQAVEKGYEGIMAKRLDSPYLPGQRSSLWLKIKAVRSLDAVVCGWTRGIGGREATFGSLILGAFVKKELTYIGRVGTGFNQFNTRVIMDLLTTLKQPSCPFSTKPRIRKPIAGWCKPEAVCEVAYLELTRDLKLRAPRFRRLRLDKGAEECQLPQP